MTSSSSSSAYAAAPPMTLQSVIVLRRLMIFLIIIASSWLGCEGMICHDDEKRALLEIKKVFNSRNHGYLSYQSNLLDWGDSTTKGQKDCCRWLGITCDPNTDHVVGIDLSSVGLSLAKETWRPNLTMLVVFGQLERLDLGHNIISGGILEDFFSPIVNSTAAGCLVKVSKSLKIFNGLSVNTKEGHKSEIFMDILPFTHKMGYLKISRNNFYLVLKEGSQPTVVENILQMMKKSHLEADDKDRV